MKTLFVSILLTLAMLQHGYCQGAFTLFNETAPTHVGAMDGPLAGPGIWAQALGGFATNSLIPINASVEHLGGGYVLRSMIVPWADVGQTIFVQMAAWDGTVWGNSFSAVPPDQFGYTDIVPVFLVSPTSPTDFPQFTQSAIVPVPEPSAFALIGLSGLALLLFRRRNRV